MMLANYINDLLYRYDCVIVPDFGGFITNRVGAKIIEESLTFYPPTKQISFNAHLKHNDGLLIDYIAKTENISFDQASERVTETVKSWQHSLKTDTVEISSVGQLFLNDEKQLVFEPNISQNFLTSSFGLSSVESEAIQRYKEQVKPLVPVLDSNEEESKNRIPLFIKYAATAAILLTLGFVGVNGYEQHQAQQKFAKQQESVQQKIQEATFIIDNPLPTISLNVSKSAPKRYHIIAGAFQITENANKKVAQLQAKGFDAKVIGKNRWGLTQVTFKSLANRTEALQELRKIKNTVSQDAWMLVKTLD